MKDWVLLLGTLIEALVISSAAALAGGLPLMIPAILVGGFCLTQRDGGYQRAVKAGSGRVLADRWMYFAEHGEMPT